MKKVHCKNCRYIIHFHNECSSSYDFCKAFMFYDNNTFVINETSLYNESGDCLVYKRKWWKIWSK
jgi:hypothetical protein